MNPAQELWWQQARSDLELFEHLRDRKIAECHKLHYLQMTTEKISKAYLWRSGAAPVKSHTGFVKFLRAIGDRSTDSNRLAGVLGFARSEDLKRWIRSSYPLTYSLQSLAPSEANNGPNPEYPWPHEAPTDHPAGHRFLLWSELLGTGPGRKMLDFVRRAVTRFDQYA